MKRTALYLLAALAASAAWAQDNTRYIDGHVTLALREEASSSGQLITFLETGQKLELLESMGPQSYARVRLPDGREGWLPNRYLTEEVPPVRRVRQLEAALAETRESASQLEAQVASLQKRLEAARPALELADRNAALEAELERQQAELQRSRAAYDAEQARQRTMVMGGMLAGGGVIFGLLLPWLVRSRRRSGYGGL